MARRSSSAPGPNRIAQSVATDGTTAELIEQSSAPWSHYGETGEQIAAAMYLSPETIRTHLRNTMRKLEASTPCRKSRSRSATARSPRPERR
jgi:hypothetical protein